MKTKENRSDFVILTVLFLIYAIYDYIWLLKNSFPPGQDEAWHLMSSLYYYNILTSGSIGSILSIDTIQKIVNVEWYYPPFFKLFTAFVYIIVGSTSMTTAIMANVVFLGILLFSTYGIGKQLFGREVGLLAAIIVSIYSSVFAYETTYLIDFSLMAMITLSIYMLLCTKLFTDFRYSLAFGIIFGLTLLTKWTAIFFIIGPLVYTTYCSFDVNRKDDISRKVIYIVLALISTVTIASIWYIPNGLTAYNLIEDTAPNYSLINGESPNIFSFSNLSYYLVAIIDQTSYLLTLIFIVGLMFLIRKNVDYIRNNSWFLLSWIVIPILVLTIQMNKNSRYSISVLPAIAIISAFWIVSMVERKSEQNKKVKILVITIVVLILGSHIISMVNSMVNSMSYGNNNDKDWKHEEILRFIKADIDIGKMDGINSTYDVNKSFWNIAVMVDSNFMSGRVFEYYSYKLGLPFSIYNCDYIGEQAFRDQFLSFDYLILKTGVGNKTNETGIYQSIMNNETIYFRQNEYNFMLIKREKLPDGSDIYIYRRRLIDD